MTEVELNQKRIETQSAILDSIKQACTQNSSGSALALAQAFGALTPNLDTRVASRSENK